MPEDVRGNVAPAAGDEPGAFPGFAQDLMGRLPGKRERSKIAFVVPIRVDFGLQFEHVISEIGAKRIAHRDPTEHLGTFPAEIGAAFEGVQAYLPIRDVNIRPADLDQFAHAPAGLKPDANEQAIAFDPAGGDELPDLCAGEVLRHAAGIQAEQGGRLGIPRDHGVRQLVLLSVFFVVHRAAVIGIVIRHKYRRDADRLEITRPGESAWRLGGDLLDPLRPPHFENAGLVDATLLDREKGFAFEYREQRVFRSVELDIDKPFDGFRMCKEDPSLADYESSRDRRDPAGDAERGRLAIELGGCLVETLADPKQSGPAERVGFHAERAREVVGAVRMQSADERRGVYPSEPAGLFDAVPARGTNVELNRQAVANDSATAADKVQAADFAETPTAARFDGHLGAAFPIGMQIAEAATGACGFHAEPAADEWNAATRGGDPCAARKRDGVGIAPGGNVRISGDRPEGFLRHKDAEEIAELARLGVG